MTKSVREWSCVPSSKGTVNLRWVKVLAFALGAFVSTCLHADTWALLVGVADYGNPKHNLEGPLNDVAALRTVLVERFGVREGQITVLQDQQATKVGIIKALNDLERLTGPNDQIFIYFSGHGTSAKDKAFRVKLPTTSGAFIPYGFRITKNTQTREEGLLVGRYDLRPIISRLDTKGRTVFVVMDTCYSGNAVRSAFGRERLPTRNVSLRAFVDDTADLDVIPWRDDGIDDQEDRYPYERVYFLGAAGEHETALDIPKHQLEHYPTIDNKPHGAFTDVLLRVLTSPLAMDANGDLALQHVEIRDAARKLMVKRGFNHTPQALPTAAQDHSRIATASFLGKQLSSPNENADDKANLERAENIQVSDLAMSARKNVPLRVTSSWKLRGLATKIKDVHWVKLDEPYDYRLHYSKAGTQGQLAYYDARGDLAAMDDVFHLKGKLNVTAVKQQLRFFNWLKNDAVAKTGSQQPLEFEIKNAGFSSTVRSGDLISYAVRSSKPAKYLLYVVDSKGMVNVLYPYLADEINQIHPAKKTVTFDNLGQISAPFGVDYVHVYGFHNLAVDLSRLALSKPFSYESPNYRALEALLKAEAAQVSSAQLPLVVVP